MAPSWRGRACDSWAEEGARSASGYLTAALPLRPLRTNFRLRNRASGPETVSFWDRNGPSCGKTHWNKWRAEPPTFSNRFCGGRRPIRHQNSTISGPEPVLRNLKYCMREREPLADISRKHDRHVPLRTYPMLRNTNLRLK